MKRAIKFTYLLALWIIGLFTFAMFATYFSEHLHSSGFFGDYVGYDWRGDTEEKWGARHYWYVAMCALLFLLSVGRILVWAFWYFDEENPANK